MLGKLRIALLFYQAKCNNKTQPRGWEPSRRRRNGEHLPPTCLWDSPHIPPELPVRKWEEIHSKVCYDIGVGGGSMLYEYGDAETRHLARHDRQLGEAIERIGPIRRTVDEDLYASVVRHILGQQISTAAQATLWARLEQRTGGVTPQTVGALSANELQQCGTTFRKVNYIQEFTEKVQNGEIDLAVLSQATDAEVIHTLAALKGIGVWTAEMILLFGLRRPDIVSFGDLGILRGMRMLYHLQSIDRETFTRYANQYSPYGTVASLYLWVIAAGALPDLADPAAAERQNAKLRKEK